MCCNDSNNFGNSWLWVILILILELVCCGSGCSCDNGCC